MKNSRLVLALCVLANLIQPNAIAVAQAEPLIAQQGTSAGEGVTNYAPSGGDAPVTPKVDTENWPWMQKEKPKSEAATEKPKAEPTAPIIDQGQLLKPEAALTAPAPSVHPAPKEISHASPSKPFHLYGRIDQLSASAGASFPQLKALTPKMDTRGAKPLQARVSDARFSGNVVSSFPTNYSGTWGGNLQLQIMQMDPSFYATDPEEARRTAQALHVGSTGAVNFQFADFGQKVSLEPARMLFMVPVKDTVQGDQMAARFLLR
jgi:hypothetical protein